MQELRMGRTHRTLISHAFACRDAYEARDVHRWPDSQRSDAQPRFGMAAAGGLLSPRHFWCFDFENAKTQTRTGRNGAILFPSLCLWTAPGGGMWRVFLCRCMFIAWQHLPFQLRSRPMMVRARPHSSSSSKRRPSTVRGVLEHDNLVRLRKCRLRTPGVSRGEGKPTDFPDEVKSRVYGMCYIKTWPL